MSSPKVIGIDLGTTNSAVAYTDEHGTTHTIAGTDGARIVPSVVYFPPDGSSPVVGEQAKQYAVVDPARVARLFKRGMGEKTFTDDGKPFEIDGKVWSPEELSSLVLMKLRDMASQHMGEPASKAVITVPAYFGEPERAATKTAGELAGLEVVRIVNEPTAAAISHGVEQTNEQGKVMVFDLGGGTFDVTIMDRGADGGLVVLGTGGDRRLGGADFDRLILDVMVGKARKDVGVDISADPWMLADASAKSEEIKKELSTLDSATRPISTGSRPLMYTLTREQFEGMISQTLQDVEDMVIGTAEKAELLLKDISTVLMVGGSSRVPAFQTLLEKLTGTQPRFSRNLDEDVARGASILAVQSVVGALDASSELALLPAPVDAASHGLGIKVMDLSTHTMINEVMIPAGTAVPSEATKTFETGEHGQKTIRIELTEGDERDLEFVRSLGETVGHFDSARDLGHPVQVTMSYTVDQLIKVSASDGKTGHHICDLEIHHSGSLTDAEKDKSRQMLATMSVR